MKKKRIYWRGFKGPYIDPFRKRKEIKRKIFILIIALPILFLLGIWATYKGYFFSPLVNTQENIIDYFFEVWPVIIFFYVFFLVSPFMLGTSKKIHLLKKLGISALIVGIITFLLLFCYLTVGSMDEGGAPGTYVPERIVFITILFSALKTLFLALFITVIGDAISRYHYK